MSPSKFFTKGSLRIHITHHVKEKHLACTQCTYKTHSRANLTRYVKTVHEHFLKYFLTVKRFLYSWLLHTRDTQVFALDNVINSCCRFHSIADNLSGYKRETIISRPDARTQPARKKCTVANNRIFTSGSSIPAYTSKELKEGLEIEYWSPQTGVCGLPVLTKGKANTGHSSCREARASNVPIP